MTKNKIMIGLLDEGLYKISIRVVVALVSIIKQESFGQLFYS